MPVTRLKLNQKAQVRRILAIYERATPQDLSEGMGWYEAANTYAEGLSEKYGLTVRQSAGIIAALSPQVSWSQNLILADGLAAGKNVGALGRSLAKAKAIRDEPDTDPLAILGGKKVRAFYGCILEPGMSLDVCIDRHAFDLAEGRIRNSEEDRHRLDRVGVYEQVATSYRVCAKALDVMPHQVQAVTWVVWRHLKNALGVQIDGGIGK